MLSRRALVGKLAAGVAGAAVAWAASPERAHAAVPRGVANPGAEPAEGQGVVEAAPISPAVADAGGQATTNVPPWELLQPLASGSALGHGWHVADLSGEADGVCVLTLRNARGRAHRVHLCRNDGRPQGLVYTERFDLVVMNGGQGDLPTEEGLAQAVAEVAHVLAANERRPELVAGLLPQRERVRLFAGAADRRLR